MVDKFTIIPPFLYVEGEGVVCGGGRVWCVEGECVVCEEGVYVCRGGVYSVYCVKEEEVEKV